MSRFPYKILPCSLRLLKLYIEFLMGFSHIFHPKGLNSPLLSEVYVFDIEFLMGFSTYSIQKVSTAPCSLNAVLETAPSVGIVSRMYISRIGKG